MKTAVSLPDSVFEAADKLAAKQGWSRSHLYAEALTEYIEKHGEDSIVKSLNSLCKEVDTSLDQDLSWASKEILKRSEWL